MAKQNKENGVSDYIRDLEKNDLSRDEMKRVAQATAPEITKTFTRHAGPREVIQHAKYKLYPIEGGVVRYFNRTKGEGFITPDDNMKKDIWVRDYERAFEDGESVNYIEVNHEALVTNKGMVKLVSGKDGQNKRIFVTSEEGKDVVLEMKPTYPMTNDGHANFVDKTKPIYPAIYPAELASLQSGDEVDFVANKQGYVVAIKKVEK